MHINKQHTVTTNNCHKNYTLTTYMNTQTYAFGPQNIVTANISFFQCENDRQLNRHDVCNVLHKTVAVHMHRYDKAAVLS